MAIHDDIGAGRARHSMRAVAPAGRFSSFTAGRGLPVLPANAALLGLVGPTAIFGILRYRRVDSDVVLLAALAVITLAALCAWIQTRWLRGYYRFMTRLGFYIIQVLGKVVPAALFFVILAPFGWILLLSGKDFLQVKSPQAKRTFWQTARQDGSLDCMF